MLWVYLCCCVCSYLHTGSNVAVQYKMSDTGRPLGVQWCDVLTACFTAMLSMICNMHDASYLVSISYTHCHTCITVFYNT